MLKQIQQFEFSGRYLLYGLVDPRNSELRYVGMTTYGLLRTRKHRTPSGNKGNEHRAKWIRKLLANGFEPQVIVLEEFSSPDGLYEAEQRAIDFYKEAGFRLTNAVDFGPGRRGARHSAETKKKIAASHVGIGKGSKHSLERRKKISIALKGRSLSDGHKQRLAILQRQVHNSRPFVDLTSGKKFKTQMEAALALSVSQTGVSAVLRGKLKSIRGHVLMYLGDQPC